MLMQSDLEGPVNIGCPQQATVNELVAAVIRVFGKKIHTKYVKGPVGLQSRNFGKARVYSLGRQAKVTLEEGISLTYSWIEAQVKARRAREHSR